MSPKREHPDAAYVADLVERFGAFAPVSARAMFGGHGLYVDGVMFALVADGALYLKTDDANRPAFEAQRLPPFTYETGGRRTVMSFCAAPEDALDDPEALRGWFEGARDAALRALAARRPRGKRGASA
ncbi:MAG: hypothetical protein AMXMBFR23_12700 [Chloroflexota bacterium]